jgi:hypothetical protein
MSDGRWQPSCGGTIGSLLDSTSRVVGQALRFAKEVADGQFFLALRTLGSLRATNLH